MAEAKNDLKERLARYRQIEITVIGRKSGKEISVPVWFVLKDEKLQLLPVQGSETQWFKNILKNPRIRISARGEKAEFRAKPLRDSKAVGSIANEFREKYGAEDVKKYCSQFDVAVLLDLNEQP